MSIGQNVKLLRKSFDLSQEHLATLLNTSQQQISYLERDLRQFSISELSTLSKYFNVPLDMIVTDDFSLYTTPNQSLNFIKLFDTLSPTDKELIVSLLNRLSSTN